MEMSPEEDSVMNELKSTRDAINLFVLTLASTPRIKKQYIEEGNRILETVTEILSLHANGFSINQSSADPPGCRWWEGRLSSFICIVLRMSRNLSPRFDKLREVLDTISLSFMDRLKAIGQSPEMVSQTDGPYKNIPVTFTPVPLTAPIEDEDKINCEKCNRKYASEKAFNLHVRKSHPEDVEQMRMEKAMNQETGRLCSVWEAGMMKQQVACLICRDQEVELRRYNEHYKAVHKRKWRAAGRKLTGFQRYADGSVKAVFSSPKKGRSRRTNQGRRASGETEAVRMEGQEEQEEQNEPNEGQGEEEEEEQDEEDQLEDDQEEEEQEGMEKTAGATIRISDWRGRNRSQDSSGDDEVNLGQGQMDPTGAGVEQNNNPPPEKGTGVPAAQAPGHCSTGSVVQPELGVEDNTGSIIFSPDRGAAMSSTHVDELCVIFGREVPEESGSGQLVEVRDNLVQQTRQVEDRKRRSRKRKERDDSCSDREDGDEESYTITRRRRKEERHDDRNKEEEEDPELHTLAGNEEFISQFDNSIQLKNKTKNKSKGDKHRYTKILFVGDESWLKHATKSLGETFRLSQLIDWQSEELVLLQIPVEWFSSVPEEIQWGGKK